MEFLIKLAKNISKIREEKGLTQAQIAEKADVSTSTVSRIETAESFPQMKTLKNIAFALSVDLEEIFHFTLPVNNDSTDTELAKELNRLVSQATKAELIYFIKMIQEYNKSVKKNNSPD